MMAQKSKSVEGLTKGIEGLFKKNKVTYVKGWGSLTSKPGEVSVAAADGEVDRRLHEDFELARHVGRPRLRLALAAAGEQRAPRRAELEQEGEIEIERRH